jgi:hypothetical protein
MAVADLDGDGDRDLVSSDAVAGSLSWFENDGRGRFTRRFIQKDEPGWFERNAVGDVDGDGRPDVVVVKNLHGDLVWFRNSGAPRDGPWQRHVITKGGMPGAYDVALADIDGDGRLDVAASGWIKGNDFVWYRNPGALDAPWTRHVIAEQLGEARTVWLADFDGDRKPDLLVTASIANLIAWFGNPGATGGAWARHPIDERSVRPIHAQAVDLDGDGDLDVLAALGSGGKPDLGNTHQVVWYENLGRPGRGAAWRKHVIADRFPQASEVTAGDLDGDGRLEVVASAWGPDGRLICFAAGADPRGPWTAHPLKEHWSKANQMVIADLDGDGRPDVVATAERGANELRWWRNEGR